MHGRKPKWHGIRIRFFFCLQKIDTYGKSPIEITKRLVVSIVSQQQSDINGLVRRYGLGRGSNWNECGQRAQPQYRDDLDVMVSLIRLSPTFQMHCNHDNTLYYIKCLLLSLTLFLNLFLHPPPSHFLASSPRSLELFVCMCSFPIICLYVEPWIAVNEWHSLEHC